MLRGVQRGGSFSVFARPYLSRYAHLFLGFVLIVACVGLCLAPLSWTEGVPFLLRMIMAVTMLIGGMMLMQSGSDNAMKELRFDALQATLYVVRQRPKRRGRVIASHAYDDIGEVDITDTELAVMDLKGRVLVSVPLDGPQDRLNAVAQMRTHLPFLI